MWGAENTVQVSAALIVQNDRLFIAQRPPRKRHGLLWEFPGGKVEAGESPQASLAREIHEELNWRVQVGKLFQVVQERNEAFSIDLYAFWCRLTGGQFQLREHVDYRWVLPAELPHYRLTSADRALIPHLRRWSDMGKDAAIEHVHTS
jgi:8-oxo-dGTP diphosphatase